MTPRERELIFKLMDGVASDKMLYVVYHLSNLKRAMDVYSWLVRHKMTGATLMDFFSRECNGQVLEVARRVLSQVEGEKKTAIVHGVDWV